jgi:hypothetical protein
MDWIRSKIRPCARLALFALAIQMAVSFGHVHRDDLGLPPFPTSDRTQLASNSAHPPAVPADQDHYPAPDDYCPICASMALVATALPSLPPVLIAPEPIRHIWPVETPVQAVSTQVTLSFQARAPPVI